MNILLRRFIIIEPISENFSNFLIVPISSIGVAVVMEVVRFAGKDFTLKTFVKVSRDVLRLQRRPKGLKDS